MQVAVLGNGGCGKTCLIRALVGFEFDPFSPPTEKRISFSTTASNNGGGEVTFIDCGHIEDEEDLRSILVQVSCVILAYDCSNLSTFSSIQTDWYDACNQQQVKQLTYFLVGCKSDLVVHDQDPEVTRFAQTNGIASFLVSARRHKNIGNLLDAIQQQQQNIFPLYVDVRAGEVSGTIPVRSINDDPLELARQFLLDHQLDESRATDLARIVHARLAEYFDAKSTTTLGRIVARLRIVLDDNTEAVLVVRHGDMAATLVDAFRRTYDMARTDPMLLEISARIDGVLRKQKKVLGDEDEDVLFLEEEEPPILRHVPSSNGTTTTRRTRFEADNADDVQQQQPLPQYRRTSPIPRPPPQQHQQQREQQEQQQQRHHVEPQPRGPTPPRHRSVRPSSSPIESPRDDINELSSFEEEDGVVPTTTTTTTRMVLPPPPPSRFTTPHPSNSRYHYTNKQLFQTPSVPRYQASTASSRSSSTVNTSSRPLLFYVDVNLGNKSERIAVCKGDNLAQLAERFIDVHRVPKTRLSRLVQLLEAHMKQHQRMRQNLG